MELEHKIPDNRAKHIMSVASLCYEIAKNKVCKNKNARRPF